MTSQTKNRHCQSWTKVKYMDSLTRKGSFFSYAIDFLFLTPFIAFATGEILACLLWKLVVRTLQKFCSTVIHSYVCGSSCKHATLSDQIPSRDGAVQNYATKTTVHHQPNEEINFHLQQHATLKAKCVSGSSWPLENGEFPVREKSPVKRKYFKGEITSQKTKDERRPRHRPRLFTVQWVTENEALKIESNETDKVVGPLNRNPNVNCQSYFEGEMFLINLHDQEYLRREEDSEDSLHREMFEWKFRKKGASKRDLKTTLGKINYAKASAHLRVNTDLDDSVQKNGIGCTPAYKSLHGWSEITEEKWYSSMYANSDNDTDTLIFATDTPVITTEKPVTASQKKEYEPVLGTLNGKAREIEETFQYNSFASIAPSIAVKRSERPAVQGLELQKNKLAEAHEQPAKMTKKETTETEEIDALEVTEISSETSEKPCYTEEKTEPHSHRFRSHPKIGPSVRDDVTEKHQKLESSLAAQPKMRQYLEKSNSPVPQRTNHKSTRAANSSKFARERVVKLTHFRLPFGRASRRTDLRKERTPVL